MFLLKSDEGIHLSQYIEHGGETYMTSFATAARLDLPPWEHWGPMTETLVVRTLDNNCILLRTPLTEQPESEANPSIVVAS